jgi:hypothetical protein
MAASIFHFILGERIAAARMPSVSFLTTSNLDVSLWLVQRARRRHPSLAPIRQKVALSCVQIRSAQQRADYCLRVVLDVIQGQRGVTPNGVEPQVPSSA